MLKFVRRFKSTSLVRSDLSSNLTKVAYKQTIIYEYYAFLEFNIGSKVLERFIE
jgi:hypothetical protein